MVIFEKCLYIHRKFSFIENDLAFLCTPGVCRCTTDNYFLLCFLRGLKNIKLSPQVVLTVSQVTLMSTTPLNAFYTRELQKQLPDSYFSTAWDFVSRKLPVAEMQFMGTNSTGSLYLFAIPKLQKNFTRPYSLIYESSTLGNLDISNFRLKSRATNPVKSRASLTKFLWLYFQNYQSSAFKIAYHYSRNENRYRCVNTPLKGECNSHETLSSL